MHKSLVRFGSVRQKKSEVRFGSGSAKNSWFGRFLIDTDIKRPGEEEVTNLVDVFHRWSKYT